MAAVSAALLPAAWDAQRALPRLSRRVISARRIAPSAGAGRSPRILLDSPGLVGLGFCAAAAASLLLLNVDSAQALDCDANSSSSSRVWELAMGFPEGPLVEEFWENVRRYALFFFTVVSGSLFAIVKPLLDLLRNPLTGILALLFIGGTLFLLSLTLSAMLGISG